VEYSEQVISKCEKEFGMVEIGEESEKSSSRSKSR
jgi:hypothetical protein